MDWQLRIALLILGVGLIGFIVYDFNRRKKAAKSKQRLIDEMHHAANSVDSAGFDSTGVGNVRKVPIEPTFGESNNGEQFSQEDKSPADNETISNNTEISSRDKEKSAPSGEQLSFEAMSEPEMVCSLILKAKEGDTFRCLCSYLKV